MCVHISRNPLEVAHSLKARNGIPVAVGLALWELYNVRALQAATELPLLRVTYEDLVGDPVRTAETIRLFLAERGSYPIRTPTECELSASLDSNLRHHHREMGALSKVATADQLALYRQLIRSETPIDAPRAVSEGSLNVLRKYEAASNVDDRRRAAMESNARRQRSHLELQNRPARHRVAYTAEPSEELPANDRLRRTVHCAARETQTGSRSEAAAQRRTRAALSQGSA